MVGVPQHGSFIDLDGLSNSQITAAAQKFPILGAPTSTTFSAMCFNLQLIKLPAVDNLAKSHGERISCQFEQI